MTRANRRDLYNTEKVATSRSKNMMVVPPQSMGACAGGFQVVAAFNRRPSRFDILCGRGKPIQEHSGNLRMRRIVAKYTKRYTAARKHKKQEIVEDVVRILKHSEGVGARFLKRVGKEDCWVEVEREVACDKVSHALRCLVRKEENGEVIDKQGNHDHVLAEPQQQGGRERTMDSSPPEFHTSRHGSDSEDKEKEDSTSLPPPLWPRARKGSLIEDIIAVQTNSSSPPPVRAKKAISLHLPLQTRPSLIDLVATSTTQAPSEDASWRRTPSSSLFGTEAALSPLSSTSMQQGMIASSAGTVGAQQVRDLCQLLPAAPSSSLLLPGGTASAAFQEGLLLAAQQQARGPSRAQTLAWLVQNQSSVTDRLTLALLAGTPAL